MPWSGLAEFVKRNRVDMLFDCASVAMDGDVLAQAIMNRVRRHALTDDSCRGRRGSRCPLPQAARQTVSATLPPLFKAYFRLGAGACGEPCHAPESGCADVLVLVNVREIDASYTRHFLDRAIRD